MPPRNDFLSQQAPENYVAGLGRGATGFTTRSDLGPAREGPSEDQIKEALAKRAAQLGTDPSSFGGGAAAGDKKDDGPEEDDRFQDPDNETGLFASGNYDRDDDEADRIYQDVDERMDKRRRARREAREQAERDDYERKNPKIQQQFADLKRSLGAVTDEEWAAIPEVGDLTGKNKRVKQQQQRRFYAVPDSVLAGASNSAQFENSVQEDGAATTNGESADGTATNFADIGRARDKVLQVRLDQAAQADAADAVANGGTSTSVDPKGYLTSLSKSLGGQGEYQLGDIKRVRSLLENVIKTNPKHAPGWIAAARVEEVAGKHVAARNVIARGCEQCPKSEDAWLENIRLNDKYNARIIAANALKNNDRSVRLWIEAMQLEDDQRAKKRVLRQALDHVPQSVAIWKEAVNLETDPADARLMLHKATEIVPLSVELWLALARLENADNAQKVLNKARKAVPTSHEIWIAASRLQEQIGEPAKVDMLMKRAVQALVKEAAMLKRDDWIQEAEKCEAEGAAKTCAAIIRETIGYGIDEDDDRRDIWIGDARDCILRGNYETARSIYSYALRIFPTSKSLWQAAAELERSHGTKESLWSIFERATNAVPKAAELWMQYAREKWSTGDVDGARVVLGKAFQENPDNEDIWLCAVELEIEVDNAQQVRKLLGDARDEAGTDRVWIKSAAFERSQGDAAAALSLISDGLSRFPKAAKLHMIKGQIYEHDMSPPRISEAREAYTAGTRACPSSVPLWLMAARLEERAGILVKARSVMDRARLAVPKNAILWVESVRIERRAGKDSAAKQLMARALQEVPPSSAGPLWAERIWHLEARNQRKNLALEAIKKVESDATLFVSVARIFWAERRLDKAASWFEKALLLDPDVGDTWAWYVKFLRQHGTPEKVEDVVTKCVLNKPRHGEVWQRVNKDIRNATKTVEQVLDLAIAQLEA